LSSIQLPVIYDPHAPEPKAWKKFIVDVFPADCVEAGVIWYILAWLMLPNTALQKALLFMSEDGGTGKSTLIKVIAAFLGLGNVAHESLQDIEENKFRAANLLGKLFNCFADLRGGEMKSSTFFKVTSGEDVVSVERKFGHSFDLISFARQCYSTNNFPVVKDAGHAFFRRWWVCKFTNRFDGTTAQRRQEEILAELSTPQELSGVLNEALKVLPCVLDPTTGIPEPPSCIAARLEFEAMTSPVSVWLAKWVTVGSDKRVEKQTLREAYNRDAASNGRPILSNMAFTGYLWRTYKNKLGEYREPYGLRRRLWTGVGLLEVANVEETEVEVVA
jgi:putative DNA primase/helicase